MATVNGGNMPTPGTLLINGEEVPITLQYVLRDMADKLDKGEVFGCVIAGYGNFLFASAAHNAPQEKGVIVGTLTHMGINFQTVMLNYMTSPPPGEPAETGPAPAPSPDDDDVHAAEIEESLAMTH